MTKLQGHFAIALLTIIVAVLALGLRRPTYVYKIETGTAARITLATRDGSDVVSCDHVGGDEFACLLRRPE